MEYHKYKYTGTGPMKLALLGDCHWGSKYCDKKLLTKTIEKLKKDKNVRIILMGDLIENAGVMTPGASNYEQDSTPNEQTWDIAKMLKPLAKKIILSHRGNHEQRSFRYSGFEIGEAIANYIGVPFVKNMAITDIQVGKITYRIYTWHGNGSSQTSAGRVRILQKQAATFEADAYCIGHVHELFSTTIPHREIINDEFKDIFRQYVLTGSFLKWDESYAEEHGWSMVKGGMPVLTLDNKNKSIKTDMEYI